jgi:hypothetical protein
MRNRRQSPFYRQRSKTMPRNNLQPPCPSPSSWSLRKIRDLIIFQQNQAQMRNKPRLPRLALCRPVGSEFPARSLQWRRTESLAKHIRPLLLLCCLRELLFPAALAIPPNFCASAQSLTLSANKSPVSSIAPKLQPQPRQRLSKSKRPKIARISARLPPMFFSITGAPKNPPAAAGAKVSPETSAARRPATHGP